MNRPNIKILATGGTIAGAGEAGGYGIKGVKTLPRVDIVYAHANGCDDDQRRHCRWCEGHRRAQLALTKTNAPARVQKMFREY